MLAEVGQIVVLKLTNGDVVSGSVLSHRKICMELLHVQDFTTKEQLAPRASFFHNEIANIEILDENGTHSPLTSKEKQEQESDDFKFLRKKQWEKEEKKKAEIKEIETKPEIEAPKQVILTSRSDFLKFHSKTKDTTPQPEETKDKQTKTIERPRPLKLSRNVSTSTSSTIESDDDKNKPIYNELNETIELDTSREDPRELALRSVQYEGIKDLVNRYWYIDEMKSDFKRALTRLKYSETIGVVGIGTENGRKSHLNILVLSTFSGIYLFDILSIKNKELWNELRVLLENRNIKKVVYDARALVDCLYHTVDVDLPNIFDLCVADQMLNETKNKKSLPECISVHLKIPEVLFVKAEKSRIQSDWMKRPLDKKAKVDAALLVAPLLFLKNKMETELLKDFNNAVNTYANSLKQLNVKDWPKLN